MRRLLPVLLLFMGVMSLADAASNRLTAKYNDGNTGNRTLTSNYDFLNRLSYITDTVGNTTYHYDLAGRRVGLLYPSGSDITTTFDALGRQAEIIGHGNSTTTRYDLVLAYDLYSNLGHQAETYTNGNLTTRTLALAYDNANRLTSELISTGSGTITNITNTFTYDAGYNRSTKVTVQKIGSGGNTTEANITYHYDAANQLNYYVNTIGSVTTNLTYDDAGNRLSSVNGTANLTYTYDVQNRLSEIDPYNSGYTSYEPVSDYAYDYRGRRAVRGQYGFVEGSSTTENITTSLFDGGNPVREQQYNYVGSSNTTPTTTLSEFIRGSDWGGGVGGILYSLHLSGNTATPSYYHYDGRGDVVAQTNSTGNLTYQTVYDSYGTHGGANGTQTFGSNTDPFQANSKEEDPSGLLDEGRRYRDLATDTFITRDPLGMAGGGPNFYTYVGQNPWTKFDPEGLAVTLSNLDHGADDQDAPMFSTPPEALMVTQMDPAAPSASAKGDAPNLDENLVQPLPSGKHMSDYVTTPAQEKAARELYDFQLALQMPQANNTPGRLLPLVPVIGTGYQLLNFIDNPSWSAAGGVLMSGIGDIGLFGGPLGEALKIGEMGEALRLGGAAESGAAESGPGLMYHYTTAPESSFEGGLWSGSSVTNKLYTDPIQAGQELGIPTPNKIIPIQNNGYFVPNSPPIVQPSFRYMGGGTDFTNPVLVPPSAIQPAIPLPPTSP